MENIWIGFVKELELKKCVKNKYVDIKKRLSYIR